MTDRLKKYAGTSFSHEDVPDGCVAIERAASVLQVDIDSPEIPFLFFQRLSKLKEAFQVSNITEWDSRSGNKHIQIDLGCRLSDHDAVFMQLFLGSDPIREYLSFRRINERISPVSQLFKPEGSLVREVSFSA